MSFLFVFLFSSVYQSQPLMLDTLSTLCWTFGATPLTFLPHQRGQRVWVSVHPHCSRCLSGRSFPPSTLLNLTARVCALAPSVSFRQFWLPCSIMPHHLLPIHPSAKKKNKLMQLIDPLFCCLFLPKFDPLNILQNLPNLANRSTLQKGFIK